MAKGGKSGDKAGSNDVPRNAREGKAVQDTDRKITQLNKTNKTAEEKLNDLLRGD